MPLPIFHKYAGHCLSAGLCLLIVLCLSVTGVLAQKTSRLDSIKNGKINLTQSRFINNIFRQAAGSIERSGAAQGLAYLNKKSEDVFMPYQGRIIRHIQIDPYNFDRSLRDTLREDHSAAARLGKALHTVTRESQVRDNLFIRENTPLNAYKVADNERFLRGLEYIHDARIIVHSLKNNPDSVDLDVITIDVFSIAGGFASNGLNHINANVFETNLAGMGQRVEVSGLYDFNRSPTYGQGYLYRKNNLFHSFVDATIGYSTMNGNGFTNEEETAQYFMLTRQLVSPYSRLAGGLTISRNQGYNLYHAPDSTFYKYEYALIDAWGGYNIGIDKLTATNNTIRDRRFLSLRYYNRDFYQTPWQVTGFNPVYNSSSALLAQITFFRQDYYRTQYIYGFGSTEDLPYGYNLSLTGGWHRQLGRDRSYFGLNAYKYIATPDGDFLQVYLKTGAFRYGTELQDVSFLGGVTAFSRMFFWNTTKIRQYINVSFSALHNAVTYAPLRIDNYYGVRGFLTDSAQGTQRLSLQSETEFFLKFKLWGFHFCPFPYVDLSLLTPAGQPFSKSGLYSSFGGGIRMRNENLVFETIELRAYFFPVAPDNMRGFKIVLNANVRYRYTSNFITPPEVVQLNNQ